METARTSTVYARRGYSSTTHIDPLAFKEITLRDLPAINHILHMSHIDTHTCDLTVGGIYMWIKYFHYTYCIYRNTLFIKGISERDSRSTAFSLPVGALPMPDAVAIIRAHCAANSIPMRFSAIPEKSLDKFLAFGDWNVTPLADWSDYLYDIKLLASLSGKKLGKKRNHVNRFLAENPGAQLHTMLIPDCESVKAAYLSWKPKAVDNGEVPGTGECTSADEERRMTLEVLRDFAYYPFEGAYLTDGAGRIVAFTVGEFIGDTLYVHIEKMDHEVEGAGETVNKMFAARMLEMYPQLKYVNREEDCGDLGLRSAKESYHPLALLRKFDLTAI